MIREHKHAARFHPARHNDRTKVVAKALGLSSMENISLMQAANSGLSWAAITRFLDCTGLSQQDLAHYLGIHALTFALRRKAGIFGKRESEQLLRLAELYQATLHLFGGDTDSARAWFTSPVRGLGSACPIDMARNEFGAREVQDLIGRLNNGIFS
ncbi:antitoxin Xre/MbcA/ParS toxin-binding domain-containing protein [Acidobacterium capsulatum]|uniref:Uncharacterized protein n=2 Tax=Acidobacterium TaxID=33973 RepID=C1F6Q3_ACIC5|nr:antitoxin Xre/MbcA/ParS toxin-binding domain-containing protein [Acidobacterium capsulatum]ACO32889.1 conserved hypothetical protein TIGR02293 [Acidobacterium capsulatum ATCC 51196]